MSTDLTFNRRDIVIALAIILLAFAYRTAIIVHRASAPADLNAWNPLTTGGDQSVYYGSIATFRAGKFPPATFFFQPGMSWFLIGASGLLGTDNLAVLRLFIAALAAINCGLMIAIGRLAFGNRAIAILAGLLLAVYPVGAFYDTDFVIASQSLELLCIALFGILWLWRRPANWTGAVLFGLSFGVIAITRFELIALAPIMALWLIWQQRSRRTLYQIALAAFLTIAVMLPTVIRNRTHGADYLITPTGPAEIYRGNNRDADGTYGGGEASAVTFSDFYSYLWKDIQLSIPRFIQLEIHKVGLYFSRNEPGNNLNYVISGAQFSPVLQINPLNFAILMGLFLFSLIVALRRKESAAALFGLLFLGMMSVTMLIWIEARIRTPVIAVMIPVVAYGLVTAFGMLRGAPHPLTPSPGTVSGNGEAKFLLIAAAASIVVLAFASFAENNLPQPVTISALPANAHIANATYDGTLKLLGWDLEEQYSHAGTIQPRQPYVVSLYWELVKPTSINYSYSLGYYQDGPSIVSYDQPVGGISYPHTPTSQWDVNRIYVDRVSTTYNYFTGPFERTGSLLLTVYPWRSAEQILPAEGLSGNPIHIQLAQVAIINPPGFLPKGLPTDISPTPFGDQLILKGWQFQSSAKPGEKIPVTLSWETTSVPIERSYSMAVYVFTSAGKFVAQADSAPHDGTLLTLSLPPNYQFGDVKNVPIPADPDTYSLYVGIYDNETHDRLAVSGTTDNLKKIGEVKVAAGD